MPRPCCSENDSQGHDTMRHGHGTACVNYHRPFTDVMSATCQRSASSCYHAEIHEGCYQKHTNPLNCRTSKQFGYFRLPRGLSRRTRHCRRMAGAWHGMCELTPHGMAGERHGHDMGTAWARHGMCELGFILTASYRRSSLKCGQKLCIFVTCCNGMPFCFTDYTDTGM
jgi:hypothetical protein